MQVRPQALERLHAVAVQLRPPVAEPQHARQTRAVDVGIQDAHA